MRFAGRLPIGHSATAERPGKHSRCRRSRDGVGIFAERLPHPGRSTVPAGECFVLPEELPPERNGAPARRGDVSPFPGSRRQNGETAPLAGGMLHPMRGMFRPVRGMSQPDGKCSGGFGERSVYLGGTFVHLGECSNFWTEHSPNLGEHSPFLGSGSPPGTEHGPAEPRG